MSLKFTKDAKNERKKCQERPEKRNLLGQSDKKQCKM